MQSGPYFVIIASRLVTAAFYAKGFQALLTDSAGLRIASSEVEAKGIEKSRNLLDKGDLTEEEKSSVKSAYRTVKYSGYKGKQELDNKLTDAQKDMIDTFDEYGYLTHDRIYLNDYRNDDYIEVAGYSRICRVTTVSGDASYLGDGKLSLQYSNFEKRSGSKPMVADVSELIEYALSFKDNRDRNFSLEEHGTCPIDADRSVWITSFSIAFDGETKEIDSIHLDGYILEK